MTGREKVFEYTVRYLTPEGEQGVVLAAVNANHAITEAVEGEGVAGEQITSVIQGGFMYYNDLEPNE